MTDKPRPKILTRLKINEVSLVDHAAGEGCRVVISKRADDDIDDWYKKEVAEEDRQNGVHDSDWYREQVAIAERQNEEHLREDAEREERDESVRKAARERFERNWNKAFAADTATDADSTPADGGNNHHASQVADLLVESGKHPDRQAALDHLLHTAHGAAMLRRLRKQQEDFTAMSTTPEQKLSDIVKRVGITALAKAIVDEDSAFSIDEHQLTALTIEAAKRDHPQLTDAQAFAAVFTAQDEGGVILRKTFHVVKAAGAAPYFDLKPQFVSGEDALDVDDPSKAIAQLKELGRQKWPSESEAEQFTRAFTDPANAELAAKAHRRPAATTLYPFPK